MPSYPTGVYSPAAKANGQTITPAMFNDPEAEIIAVENALLNGIPHGITISTGGLTVSTGNTVLGQNLSVGGGSTLASLDVAGGSTFHGPVTFSSAVTFAVTPGLSIPRVHLTIGADQNLPATANTGLSWPTNTYDSHGMHSTAVNSSRITFVDSSGIYHIGASVDFASASSGVRVLRILLNDTSAVAANGLFAPSAPPFTVPLSVSADVRIADTTVYAIVQVVNGAATSNSATSTGSYITAFWAHKVSS